MSGLEDLLTQMRRNPRDVRFNDFGRVCDHYFGEPRQRGSSHRIHKAPWQGDPRISIQNDKRKAKA